MVQQVLVRHVDDLDPSIAAEETVCFDLDGVAYEIDLSRDHAAALRAVFTPYIEHATKTGHHRPDVRVGMLASPRPSSAPRGRARGQKQVDRNESQAVRAWARDQGMTVNERGRISNEVLDAWLHRNDRPAPAEETASPQLALTDADAELAPVRTRTTKAAVTKAGRVPAKSTRATGTRKR